MNDAVKESRKEQLAKAWDAVEEKEDADTSGPDNEAPVGKSAAADADTGDTKDPPREEPKEKAEEAPLAKEQNKREAEAAAAVEKPAAPVPVTDKAPNSWKPAVREHWAKLPPEVRAEIRQRELHIQQELTQTGQIRKFANDFANVIQPYSHLIRAQNSTPLQAVQNLMNTAAGLMQGNQEQKARIVSEIISNYGIDIPTLDRVLSSSTNPGAAPHPAAAAPPPWAQPMFAFMDNVQRMQQERQEQMAREAAAAIEQFTDKPYFEDVREDMADLMEQAAKRGRTMTMEQAYERAIALNPEIHKIVEQRKLAERNRNPVSEAAATLARARKAASTVKGAPQAAVASANSKLSRKEQLRQAWDDQS